MTQRENMVKALRGEIPEFVPEFETAAVLLIPAIFLSHFATEEKRDFFSVPWAINGSGPMVDTHQPYVMEDINDWKNFVHFPDLDAFPWEAVAAQQLEECGDDKAVVIMPNLGGGTLFMPLMNMMGFEEGLCALVDEPEVCNEFFGYVSDFLISTIPYIKKYYNPDVFIIGDDLATAQHPFISMDIFRETLKEHYQKQINALHDADIHVELHMCGKCECFVEDFVEMGIESWQPAQTSNDLAGLKAKYGNKLVIVGGWDTQGPVWEPGAPEESVREEVHKVIDKFAPGGGFILWTGGNVGMSDDQVTKNSWVSDECAIYGKNFYK